MLVGGKLTSSSVFGGGSDDTTTDGADSLSIVGSVSASFVQGNAGNDTIDFTEVVIGSSARGGAGDDQLYLDKAVSADSYITGDRGSDTLTLAGVVKTGTSVFGGSLTDTTGDAADSITFSTAPSQLPLFKVTLVMTH